MSFVDTLIEETRNGNLDSIWKYNDGQKTYSLNISKSPYNGLHFDSTLQDLSIVFPNGACLVNIPKDKLQILVEEINDAVIRNMNYLTSNYIKTRIL